MSVSLPSESCQNFTFISSSIVKSIQFWSPFDWINNEMLKQMVGNQFCQNTMTTTQKPQMLCTMYVFVCIYLYYYIIS